MILFVGYDLPFQYVYSQFVIVPIIMSSMHQFTVTNLSSSMELYLYIFSWCMIHIMIDTLRVYNQSYLCLLSSCSFPKSLLHPTEIHKPQEEIAEDTGNSSSSFLIRQNFLMQAFRNMKEHSIKKRWDSTRRMRVITLSKTTPHVEDVDKDEYESWLEESGLNDG